MEAVACKGETVFPYPSPIFSYDQARRVQNHIAPGEINEYTKGGFGLSDQGSYNCPRA